MGEAMIELAMLFKERDNRHQESFVIGTVKSLVPLIIDDGDHILVEREQMVMADGLQLTKGDKVLMIPSGDGQLYAVLCKVG